MEHIALAILAVGFGCIVAWIFKNVPDQQGSEGRAILVGTITVFLFFAALIAALAVFIL